MGTTGMKFTTDMVIVGGGGAGLIAIVKPIEIKSKLFFYFCAAFCKKCGKKYNHIGARRS